MKYFILFDVGGDGFNQFSVPSHQPSEVIDPEKSKAGEKGYFSFILYCKILYTVVFIYKTKHHIIHGSIPASKHIETFVILQYSVLMYSARFKGANTRT